MVPVQDHQNTKKTASSTGDRKGTNDPSVAETAYTLAIEDDTSTVSLKSQNTGLSLGVKSHNTLSSTDGVDILGEPRPQTFRQWNSSWTGRLVQDRWFKMAVNTLIVVSSLLLGLSTTEFVAERPELGSMFYTVVRVILVAFTLELIAQLVHHGLRFYKQGWLCFDAFIVIVGWIHPPFIVIRTFRLIRSLRLATRVKDLKQMALALIRAVPKVIAIVFLLMLVFYVFAVLFTDLFKDLYARGLTSEDYFSRLDLTAFTLFQIMTLDGWSTLTKEVMEVYSWAWLPFIAFVVVASYFFLSLIVAVVCESVSAVQNEQVLKTFTEALPSKSEGNREDMQRLERKVDELMETMHVLMHQQMLLQEMIRQQPGDGAVTIS